MTLEKTQNGKVKYSSQLKTQSLDDLDTVARRLTRSVVEEMLVTQDIAVNDVTETESQHPFADAPNQSLVLRFWSV